MGIFPASHVHVRDHLADAEGRLADVYHRMVNDQSEGTRTLVGPGPMETLREEPEDPGSEKSSSSRARSARGPLPPRHPSPPADETTYNTLVDTSAASPDPRQLKPRPPRPSVKSSDETTSGASQPLVDEIASALREWHPLMFKHLQCRDYRLFEVVKAHIEALHLGRRQLLTHSLSVEEMSNLRRDCVIRLVQGNVAQGLDIIVRHPTWGALVTVDSDSEADARSWMGALRMYALQASLAYVNQDTSAATTIAKTSALSTPPARSRLSMNPSSGYPAFPLSKGVANTPRPTASFFHLYFELKAFVASPCAPGETAELYFSLYNKTTGQLVTEDFCAILNHNGVSSRDPEGRFGPVRTFFRDMGERDIQDEIFLVCRIVRNGAMKIGGVASTNGAHGGYGPNGTISNKRRGSEPLYRLSEVGDVTHGDVSVSSNGGPVGSHSRTPGTDCVPTTFRRPFGAGVVSLDVSQNFTDGTDATEMTECSLPIFVPTNEATFSTLHQYLIGSNTKEFEQSPRFTLLFVYEKCPENADKCIPGLNE